MLGLGGFERAPLRPAMRQRGGLYPEGAEAWLGSGSWGKNFAADRAHPVRQRLNLEQEKVYGILNSRMWGGTEPEYPGAPGYRQCDVGLSELAALTGLHAMSVRRAIKDLVSLRLVQKERRWERAKGRARAREMPTRYTLLPVQDLLPLDDLAGHILFAPLGDAPVDLAPADGDWLSPDEHEALQEAAQQRVSLLLLPQLQAALGALDQAAEQLFALADRVGWMLVGRPIDALLDEARQRAVYEATLAGRAPPKGPLKDTLRSRLEAVGRATATNNPARQRVPEAYQDALRAQDAWKAATRAVDGAHQRVSEQMARVERQAPRDGDWRKALADARFALYAQAQAVFLVAQVEAALQTAERVWGRLPKPPAPPPPPTLQQGEDPDGPRPDGRGGWWPPRRWRERVPDHSPARWRAAMAAWEDATARKLGKTRARLRRQGFRPDWPEPPS